LHRLEERAPLLGVVRQHADEAVGALVGPAVFHHRALVACRSDRRLEALAGGVLDQVEADEALQHRHLDQLALAQPVAGEQRGDGGVHRELGADLVADRGVDEPRRAVAAALHRGHAREALDDIVIGRSRSVGPVLPEADQGDVDQPRVHAPAIRVAAESAH